MNINRLILSTVALSLLQSSHASGPLPRSTPEEQGVSSRAIIDLAQAAAVDPDQSWHGFVIIRHGHIVAEGYYAPFKEGQKHLLHSLTKSFTSTAVGLAVSEGLLDIDTPLIDFFPDETPENPGEHLRAMRLRQLLTMDTGHLEEPQGKNDPTGDKSTFRQFLDEPVELRPGTHFLYNSFGTYMLCAVLQRVTGQGMLDYLTPRVLEPLGISGARILKSRDGVDRGAGGLYLSTMDIARFGQMLLQHGEWNGQQLVPAAWLAEATRKQVSNGSDPENDWEVGYGFQFWMNSVGGYRADGAFGQVCLVLPEYDLVVAANANLRDMGQGFHWVWDNLLPGLSNEPLPADPEALERLHETLASLQVPLPEGASHSAIEAGVSGKTYRLEPNFTRFDTVSFSFDGDAGIMRVAGPWGEARTPFGLGKWVAGDLAPHPSAAGIPIDLAAAWSSPDTLDLWIFVEGETRMVNLVFRFSGDNVEMKCRVPGDWVLPDFQTVIGRTKDEGPRTKD